ncbi:hypothetical protein OAD22_11340, partial [Pseudomonadales bacterium]|nr:hypothetical protein [Pseudomonadales bacterium]
IAVDHLCVSASHLKTDKHVGYDGQPLTARINKCNCDANYLHLSFYLLFIINISMRTRDIA